MKLARILFSVLIGLPILITIGIFLQFIVLVLSVFGIKVNTEYPDIIGAKTLALFKRFVEWQ